MHSGDAAAVTVTGRYSPDMGTIWEAKSQNLKYKAVGGMGAPRYRLTDEFLYVETGTLRSDMQQIRVVDIVDVDMSQSMMQKSRGVGDVTLHVERAGGGEVVTLESVPDPRLVQELINDATRSRKIFDQRQANVYTHAATMPAPPAQSGPPAGWYADAQHPELLRWWDGMRWTEHTRPMPQQ